MTRTTLSQTQQTIQLINRSGYNKNTTNQTIVIHTDSYIQQSAQYNNKIAMPADCLDAHSVRSTARPPSIRSPLPALHPPRSTARCIRSPRITRRTVSPHVITMRVRLAQRPGLSGVSQAAGLPPRRPH